MQFHLRGAFSFAPWRNGYLPLTTTNQLIRGIPFVPEPPPTLAAGAMNVKTHCIHAVTMDTYSHVVTGLRDAAAKGFDQGLRKHKNADHLVGTGDGD